MDTLSQKSLKDQWRDLAEMLDEALNQNHKIDLGLIVDLEINPSEFISNDSSDSLTNPEDGEIFYFTRSGRILHGRKKTTTDLLRRPTSCQEIVYNNSLDRPYAVDQPVHIKTQAVDSLAEVSENRPSRILAAECSLNGGNSEQTVRTCWTRIPLLIESNQITINTNQAIEREVGVRYINDQIARAYIVEYDQLDDIPWEYNEQPSSGRPDVQLLMRSVRGVFNDNQSLVSINAFERLGLNQYQIEANLTINSRGQIEQNQRIVP